MIHYYIKPVVINGKMVSIDAENIDNLRKRLIRDGYLDRSPSDYRILILGGSFPGAPLNEVGRIFRASDGNVFWMSEMSKHTRKVSPKTGALLDVDKYWKWY